MRPTGLIYLNVCVWGGDLLIVSHPIDPFLPKHKELPLWSGVARPTAPFYGLLGTVYSTPFELVVAVLPMIDIKIEFPKGCVAVDFLFFWRASLV